MKINNLTPNQERILKKFLQNTGLTLKRTGSGSFSCFRICNYSGYEVYICKETNGKFKAYQLGDGEYTLSRVLRRVKRFFRA